MDTHNASYSSTILDDNGHCEMYVYLHVKTQGISSRQLASLNFVSLACTSLHVTRRCARCYVVSETMRPNAFKTSP